MLTLPIKKKWFDMILSGEKKEEYRKIEQSIGETYGYYESRFKNLYTGYAIEWNPTENMIENIPIVEIIFKNGYGKNSPKIKCRVKIYNGYGKEEWGAEPNELYYVLKILNVEEVSND